MKGRKKIYSKKIKKIIKMKEKYTLTKEKKVSQKVRKK